MFKKLNKSKFIIILFIIICILTPITFADDTNEIIDNYSTIKKEIVETIETNSKINDIPNINSRSAIVIDRKSNTILYSKNENEIRKMASTTKIMTCLIVLENSNLTDVVEISKKSAGTGGSRLGLKTGDKITINDLLYGLMLCSGNDAAVALAETIGGNIENFAALMNNKAKEIGLNNTNFVTPHGLDSENHYTTAYELALLTNYALKNETFSKIVGTKNYTININGYPKNISNTNELLGNLNGVYGVKTGFTNGANRCLVTACKRNNLDIICVVLGADTKKFRTQDSIKLIEYTFKNYTPINIQQILDKKFNKWKLNNINDFNIIKGKNKNIEIKPINLKNSIIPIDNSLINSINIFINCKKTLNAPIFAGTSIGSIEIYSNDKNIATTDIIIENDIRKKDIWDYFTELFKYYKK